jgi:hypothetical protein
MKQSLMKDMGLKLVSLGLAVMLWWIIKLRADLRYSYDKHNTAPPAPALNTNSHSLTNAFPGITPKEDPTKE